MLIDIHAHLDDQQFDGDRQAVIRRAFENGIEKIINIGAGIGSSERSVQLAQKEENVYASVGLHPNYFDHYQEKSWAYFSRLEELAKEKKVVAIGEIGLDYFRRNGEKITKIQKENQQKGFKDQLKLAQKLKLPVIIHCRGARAEKNKLYRETSEAYEDVLAIIKKFPQLRYIFHSFGGRLDFTKKVLQFKNIGFSFTGNITYAKPKAEILKVIKTIPLEKIMVETDCPYLAPEPMRGKRNEPAYVRYTAEKIATIKELTLEEIATATIKNATIFFKI
jgi:TatD DNase family protein